MSSQKSSRLVTLLINVSVCVLVTCPLIRLNGQTSSKSKPPPELPDSQALQAPLPTVTLRTPNGLITFPYENMGGVPVTQGDIVLDRVDSIRSMAATSPSGTRCAPVAARGGKAVRFTSAAAYNVLWDGGEIPFVIDKDAPNPDRINAAIEHYRTRTPINFVPRTNQLDHVVFEKVFNPISPTSSHSPVGKQGGRQVLALTENATVRTIIHEMGHTIGLYHEQARSDRDDFIKINYNCIPLIFWPQFNKFSDFPARPGLNLEAYDTSSVMHYSSFTYSNANDQSCPTITQHDGSLITPSTQLTINDINGIYRLYGEFKGSNDSDEEFGRALAVGDFDDDGHADLAVGAPRDSNGGVRAAGAIYLLKGTDGGLVPWEVIGSSAPHSRALFGFSLASGDFNGDGVDDLAVGAIGESHGTGRQNGGVHIFQGRARTGLRSAGFWDQRTAGYNENQELAAFGYSLAAGDVDGDGFDDLVIGAPKRSPWIPTNPRAGQVTVLHGTPETGTSGLTLGVNLPEFGAGIPEDDDQVGHSVAVGDIDHDGIGDIVVGAPRDAPTVWGRTTDSGSAFIFRGTRTGPQAWQLVTQRPLEFEESGDKFGFALAVGEFDGQPGADLAVSSPGENFSSKWDAGAFFLFRGTTSGVSPWVVITQSPLDQAEDGDEFGYSLLAADLDGDGDQDLAVGTISESVEPDFRSGLVSLFRQSSGQLTPWMTLHQIDSYGRREGGDAFGSKIAFGDFNQDGIGDLVISAPRHAPPGAPRSGIIYTFGGVHNSQPNADGRGAAVKN